MLSFITYKNAVEQLEIIVDDQGVDDLIDYLKYIKAKKDHMHLIIDAELDRYSIPKEKEENIFYAKKVTIFYEDSSKNG